MDKNIKCKNLKGQLNIIEIKDDIISSVFMDSESNLECDDFSKYTAIPGFVDIHMHGCLGVDVGTCTVQSLLNMCAGMISHGVTSFLPTLPAMKPDDSIRALGVIKEAMEIQNQQVNIKAAKILGAHMEGPFMKPEYKGALDEKTFLDATKENFKKITGDYQSIVRRITLDPLAKGALNLIPYLTSLGISVSLGHTAADSQTIKNAFLQGATSVTHIFNAMPPLHHRNPGPVGASLADDESYAEMILDFLHVSPIACKTVIKAKGENNVVIITDSCEAAGMPDGNYVLNGNPVVVINGEARIPAGNLASSTVFMDKELKNIMTLGVSLFQASKMLSTNAAKLINRNNIGNIKEGYYADLLLIDDKFEIKQIFVNGNPIF